MTQRILILRLSALGDIIHGLPVASALRHAFPDAHLGWLVEDRGAVLLSNNPIIDRVHVLPRQVLKKDFKKNPFKTLNGPLGALVRELRAEHYKVSIDLQGLTKSSAWGMLAGAGMRIGFRGADAREMSSWFYNEAITPPDDCVHVIRRNLSLLSPLGVKNPKIEFPFRLGESALLRGREIWNPSNNLVDQEPLRIVLNIGAGWPTKMWPAAMFGELGAKLVRNHGACVAIAWGPGEEAIAERALNAGKKAGLTTEQLGRNGIQMRPGLFMTPPTSMMELGGVIAASKLYVGGDTGPTHMAAALGVPVVSPFGASDALRNGPLGARVETVQLEKPACIPCWKTECSWNEPLACLKNISVQDLYDACETFID